MGSDDIKVRVTEFRRRLYLDHDLSAVDDYVHRDFRSHNALIKPGAAGYREFVAGFHAGMPDLRPAVHHILAEGHRVVTFVHWTATHTGPFRGIPPTGRKIAFETADIFRVQDGLFIEHWDVVDRLSVAEALGLFRAVDAGVKP